MVPTLVENSKFFWLDFFTKKCFKNNNIMSVADPGKGAQAHAPHPYKIACKIEHSNKAVTVFMRQCSLSIYEAIKILIYIIYI